ncbi:hypothetical protein B7486_16645 [cyanobacterium TDX16]|nr:hypothetical protein B7486_16645 [cyanobacterium TDX16]
MPVMNQPSDGPEAESHRPEDPVLEDNGQTRCLGDADLRWAHRPTIIWLCEGTVRPATHIACTSGNRRFGRAESAHYRRFQKATSHAGHAARITHRELVHQMARHDPKAEYGAIGQSVRENWSVSESLAAPSRAVSPKPRS